LIRYDDDAQIGPDVTFKTFY